MFDEGFNKIFATERQLVDTDHGTEVLMKLEAQLHWSVPLILTDGGQGIPGVVRCFMIESLTHSSPSASLF